MNTVISIFLGVVIVFSSFYFEGGSPYWVLSWTATLVVIGGAILATLAGSNLSEIRKLPQLIKVAFTTKRYDYQKQIDLIVFLSTKARKDGVLTLESELDKVKDPLLRKIIQYAIDGVEKETYEKLCETELNYITDRHEVYIDLFQRLAGFSPTMGVLGTIIALITTLANAAEEPNLLIRKIAFAFITTFWGIFMANFFWLPISDKLRSKHNEEMQVFQMMVDGVYGIVVGELPSVIRARLSGFYPTQEQFKILNERAKFKSLKKGEN